MTIDQQTAAIDQELAALNAHRDALLSARLNLQRKRMVRCVHCKKRTRINKLTYLQYHWYEPPSGCSGGDYWVAGEGGFRCPKCDQVNRLWYRAATKHIKARASHAHAKLLLSLKNVFARVEDVYEH